VLLFVWGGAAVCGLDIVMIPVTYYEKQGAGYAQKAYRRDITADIAGMLNKYYSIQISRAPINDRLAGVTDYDARRAAEHYNVDEVLYGAIKDDGSSLQAELKIYNRRRDDYGLFFASDASGRYERLVHTVCERVMEWYNTERDKVDALKHEVEGLRAEVESMKRETGNRKKAAAEERRKAQEETEKEFALRLPVNAGYWSYVESPWVESVQGTAEAAVGLELFPELQFPALGGMKNEMSLGLSIGYRNGVTRNKGAVLMHGVFINPGIKYHLNFYTENWVCIGGGVFYEFDMWRIEDGEYRQNTDFNQSLTGYSVSLDYAYRVNRLFTVNMGANLYGYFAAESSLVVRPYVGMVITLAGGWREK
jgi:hypothetical protein